MKPLLTEEFRNEMYKNMWSYINLDMIQTIFQQLGLNLKVSRKKNINDYDYTPAEKYKNTLCYKGKEDDDKETGHYVYIDNNLQDWGTYENRLLASSEDDGMCHSVAIIFTLKASGIFGDNFPFPIIINPRYKKDFIKNYISILSLYKWIIEEGYWDQALKEHFYKSVEWDRRERTTSQTKKALIALRNYINILRNLL